MTSYPVTIGEKIAGKYLVERVIGEGGMGMVVAARHLELDQMVAIKFLLPQIAEHTTAAQRFRREARAAARIRGEHACRVLDVATLETGVPYLVMEYLEGCDLSTELARRRRLPVEEAVDYLLQACEALAEAHAGGIVHRDLKPGNFFLAVRSDGSRCLKVLDFGVSKLLTDSDAGHLGLTSTATMIGSPLYMSPEQLESAKDVDARTDIWGLGCVLYELITGRTPFMADSLAQLTHAVLSGQPPSCGALGISIPEGLERIIERALSKRREHRYASVVELARALVPYGPAHGAVSAARVARLLPGSSMRTASEGVTGQGLSLRGGAGSSGSASGFPSMSRASGTPASWERGGKPAPKRRNIGLAMLALALFVIAGFTVYRIGIGTRMANAPETAPADAPQRSAAAPAPNEHEVRPANLEAKPATAPMPVPTDPPAIELAPPQPAPKQPPARERANAVAPARVLPPKLARPAVPPPPEQKPTDPESQGNISDFGGRR
jgi:eukaryotic-like serine/threonine-protein kinase